MSGFPRAVLSPVYAVLAVVLVASAYLRANAVDETAILFPYRADSAQYYNYAFNLRHFGVYSLEGDSVVGKGDHPSPDAMRTPGYSLFLAMFADAPPNREIFKRVCLGQAAMGTLAVLLLFVLFRQMAPAWLALVAVIPAAISPHLVNICVYVLSENLFLFLVVAALCVLGLAPLKGRWFLPAMLGAGLLIGAGALTRPVLEYFLPCLLVLAFLRFPGRDGIKACAFLALGFILVWGPWVGRNLATLGKTGDDRLMLETLHQGMYPGLMYQNNPDSRGYPYRFDPNYKRTSTDLKSVLEEVARQWREQPFTELKWYLFGKPVQLWSWSMVSGPGDIYIYAALVSPYFKDPLYMATHVIMYGLHGLLIVLALFMCIFAFLPAARRFFPPRGIFVLQAMSLLLLYNTAVLMIGAPFTRYSTPLLPFAYGMGVLSVQVLACFMIEARARSRALYFARRQ